MKYVYSLLAVSLLVGIGLALALAFVPYLTNATGGLVLPANTANLSSNIVVGPQEMIQVAATSSRTYLFLENSTGTADVWCMADGDAPATEGTGIRLASSTDLTYSRNYEWHIEKNYYQGAVRCTASASTTINRLEYLLR